MNRQLFSRIADKRTSKKSMGGVINQKIFPLEELPPGSSAVVRQMGGGKDFASHLSAMGLSKGSKLRMLQNTGHGPLLVLVRDTRIALGRGQALKIMVEKLPSEQQVVADE